MYKLYVYVFVCVHVYFNIFNFMVGISKAYILISILVAISSAWLRKHIYMNF
jgi:hypothetical protein